MTDYDRIAYPSAPLPRTHPHFLGGIALQYGLDFDPPHRVLDTGCGAGRNLAWIAATLPESTCVGVDLAGSAVGEARAFASRLGLTNIEFVHADFDAATEGDYDCIVNGLYSWVDPAVRVRLLEFVERRLAARGVAMISFHEEHRPWRRPLLAIADPIARLAAAKTLRPELAALDDGLLLHDALAEVSDPVSVVEFIQALPAGLEYLCDTRGADALVEFHEAVVVRSERVAAEPLFDRMWFVTEESFPATIHECDDEEIVVVEALSAPREVVSRAGKHPVAWGPARVLASGGDREIMNYFGGLVELDDEDRALLARLDGSVAGEAIAPESLEFFARAGLLVR